MAMTMDLHCLWHVYPSVFTICKTNWCLWHVLTKLIPNEYLIISAMSITNKSMKYFGRLWGLYHGKMRGSNSCVVILMEVSLHGMSNLRRKLPLSIPLMVNIDSNRVVGTFTTCFASKDLEFGREIKIAVDTSGRKL